MAHELKHGASSAADEHKTEAARILSAEFVASYVSLADLPRAGLPEIAFVGRSNVGKSSLFNALCRRRNLARVSKTPGRTQSLNFFHVKLRGAGKEAETSEAYFVDLPGFGYAAVGKKERAWWSEALSEYILHRQELRLVLLLVDSRRDLGPEEGWFFDSPVQDRLSLILTKSDQLNRAEFTAKQKTITENVDLNPEQVFFVSTLKREQLDRSGLEQAIVAACQRDE